MFIVQTTGKKDSASIATLVSHKKLLQALSFTSDVQLYQLDLLASFHLAECRSTMLHSRNLLPYSQELGLAVIMLLLLYY
jgi:hypothetical protein